MIPLPMKDRASFYTPSEETLKVLNNREWICAYSGGKDSTSLLLLIEWLRRTGQVKVDKPRVVQSDTEVEFPFLRSISEKLINILVSCGWIYQEVKPPIHKKLYNSIFGRGVPPVHPGFKRKMRWCTQATKVGPMHYLGRTITDEMVMITGVRWGESRTRDEKMMTSGCTAGGECGLPPLGETRYGPIITWTTCQVTDWLSGLVSSKVVDVIKDLLEVSKELITVYNVKKRKSLGLVPTKVNSLRFGCIGCPAISKDKVIDAHVKKYPNWKHLRRIYLIWNRLYLHKNRIGKERNGRFIWGPVKMEVRKQLFPELLDIQNKAGVVLVDANDIAFIHDCWEKKVYPRGWSEKDELN